MSRYTNKPIEWITNEKGCHLVISHTVNKYGYVVVCRNGKQYKLHRLAYSEKYGEIPKGKIIMHTCDNRNCINIDHLKLGTHKDNTQDMLDKERGRAGRNKGVFPIHIEKVRKSKGISQTWLADQSNVSRNFLYQIEKGNCRVSLKTLQKIADTLQIDINQLF